MRSTLVAVALVACGSPTSAVRQEPGPAVALPPPELVPERPGCASVDDPIDVVGFEAVPFPLDAQGRALTVELSAEGPARVVCRLDAGPTTWRQLLPANATWRWSEVEPAGDFHATQYDDSGWTSGPAPFGHAQDVATVLAPDSEDGPERAWFRATFDVADASAVQALEAGIRRDDGVVVWLNGVEVVRDNVPVEVRIDGDDAERALRTFVLDPALLVQGQNTLAAQLEQHDGPGDAGFSLRLAAEVYELLPETHTVDSTFPAARHELELHGLLADANYTCVAAADPCGSWLTASVPTDPLPVPIRLAAPPAMDPAGAGYLLFNHSRPCAGDTSNRLLVVDPEGRVRWHHELPIDDVSSIDIVSRYLSDGTILWGGGDEPEGDPQLVGLDGETRYVAGYPAATEDKYHHDVELTADGMILGLIDADATDGVAEWQGFALVEHDPLTGEETWRWDAQDAFDRGELPSPEDGERDPWHPNSLASVEDQEGPAVYVSLFDTREILRIDRTTGQVTWRLGEGGDFALPDGEWFDVLHAVDVVDGRIFLYDNGVTRDRSRALAMVLDPVTREATIDWEWSEPGWYEPNWGDADPTGRGTVLITMSHAECQGGFADHPGAFVEVDEATGEVAARLDFLDGADSTYRGQRIDGCSLFVNDRYCR